MINLRRLSRRAAALIALAAILGFNIRPAEALEKVTYAYQLDPMFEAAMWGLKNGKIKSDKVEVELTVLPIPALIQATPTKQFDVIQSDTIAVPRSAERGLQLVIMSTAIRYKPDGQGHHIFVAKDSKAQSLQDLKGAKVGVPSVGSAGFHLLRFALAEKYKMNVDVAGGDFVFVEMPGPSLLAALSQQKTDAATFILSQTFLATSSGQFRPLVQPARDMYELWGLQMIPSVNVSYPEKLQARPEAFREFNRMIKASVDYLNANPDEVYSAVAKEQNIDKAFFATLFKSYAEYPGVLSAQDRKAIAKTWELAQKYKILTSVPEVDRFVWAGAIGD